jgi:hypothetical protein
MATTMEANARHGDESEVAHRRNSTIRIWVIAAVVAVLAVIALMSGTATGPGANTGRVSNETSKVQGGVAPPNPEEPPTARPARLPTRRRRSSGQHREDPSPACVRPAGPIFETRRAGAERP